MISSTRPTHADHEAISDAPSTEMDDPNEGRGGKRFGRRRLRVEAAPAASPLVGVEHEYQLFDENDEQVDFRTLIHGFALGARHLDPADPNAYRLATGAALTCDGAEAEIALPPVPLAAGFGTEVASRAWHERCRLEQLVPGLRVAGYSTHVSVSTPPAIGDAVASLYTRTFAPALMLLMDRPTSPGLLVRPRPGRTELGGEYVDGDRLRVVATFAAGSVLACHAAVTRNAPVPPALNAHVLDDDHRYGWFVSRSAFGLDLYIEGRDTQLLLAAGGTTTAQQHLEHSWTIARDALGEHIGAPEMRPIDELVWGTTPLPIAASATRAGASAGPFGPSPFGDVLTTRHRPGFDITPVMVTWGAAVLLAYSPATDRKAFIPVTCTQLGEYLQALDAGRYDAVIAYRLRRPHPIGHRLRHRRHLSMDRLYDRLGPRRRLLQRERAAVGGHPRKDGARDLIQRLDSSIEDAQAKVAAQA